METYGIDVAFKYEGGLADTGGLDGSDHAAQVEGSKRLLALNIHTFLHGHVPRAAKTDGRRYHIVHMGSRKGSHVDDWRIYIDLAAVAVGLGDIAVHLYGDKIRSSLDRGAGFLVDSLRAATGIGSRHLPSFEHRIEPILEAIDGNREPIIDYEAEHRLDRGRLREATARVLYGDATRPLGRCADLLTIYVRGQPAVVIGPHDKRRYLAQQIEFEIAAMREGGLLEAAALRD